MNRIRLIACRPAVALILALTMSSAAAEAQTKIKSGFNLFSPEQDVQVGQQSAAEAEQQLPMVNDASVNAYVDRIGQRLAANAGGPQFQYRFRVVNQTDINAFALPGGFVYINRGVLDNARNEGEVAGVIAHEISHVALRHGTHQASKAYAAQTGIGILGGLLGGHIGQGTADILNAVGGVGLNALFLKFSRDLETQADVRGSQILAASGYSPGDMIGFFQTLERVDNSKKTNWLSDHPAPPDRVARIQKEAQMLHVSASPTTNVAELRQVQNRLNGLSGSRSPQAIASNRPASSGGRSRPSMSSSSSAGVNVDPPSGTMSSYTSPTGLYRVSYPSNWQVYQGSSAGVTLAPQGGIGNVNGNNDVIVGAIINHYDPFGSQQQGSRLRGTGGNVYGNNITLEDATNDLIGQIQQSSPYLRANATGQRVKMANGTALAATLRGVDPQTNVSERITVVTRQLADDHLIYLLFVTPDKDASRYSSVLNTMVNSMQIATGQQH